MSIIYLPLRIFISILMKTEYQINIISRLKSERDNHFLSQKDVADLLGISYGFLGKIESPKQEGKYNLAQIQLLCKIYKISIVELFIPNSHLEGTDLINALINAIIEYENL